MFRLKVDSGAEASDVDGHLVAGTRYVIAPVSQSKVEGENLSAELGSPECLYYSENCESTPGAGI